MRAVSVVLAFAIAAFAGCGCTSAEKNVEKKGAKLDEAIVNASEAAQKAVGKAEGTKTLADRADAEAGLLADSIPADSPAKSLAVDHKKTTVELKMSAGETVTAAKDTESTIVEIKKHAETLQQTATEQAVELDKLKKAQTGFWGWAIAYSWLFAGGVLFVASAYCMFALKSKWLALLLAVAGTLGLLRYMMVATVGLLNRITGLGYIIVIVILIGLVIFLWKSLKGVTQAVYQEYQDGEVSAEKIAEIANENTPDGLGRIIGWWKALIPNKK